MSNIFYKFPFVIITFCALSLQGTPTPDETLKWLNDRHAGTHPQLDTIKANELSKITSLEIGRQCVIDEELNHLENIPNLSELSIYNDDCPNQLKGPGLEFIAKLSKLSYLDLDYNQINPEFFSFLTKLGDLESLKIIGNDLNGKDLSALKEIRNLKILDLSLNKIGGEEGEKTLKSIAAHSKLETLKIPANPWDSRALSGLRGSTIKNLVLNVDKMSKLSKLDKTTAIQLIQDLSKLETLYVGPAPQEVFEALVVSPIKFVDYRMVNTSHISIRISPLGFLHSVQFGSLSQVVLDQVFLEAAEKDSSYANELYKAIQARKELNLKIPDLSEEMLQYLLKGNLLSLAQKLDLGEFGSVSEIVLSSILSAATQTREALLSGAVEDEAFAKLQAKFPIIKFSRN